MIETDESVRNIFLFVLETSERERERETEHR